MANKTITENRAELEKKWAPIIEDVNSPKISDAHRRDVTIQILENQHICIQEEKAQLLRETPTNNYGSGNIGAWDPILISLVRRAMPNLIAYDVCGVQPMSGPTGLIFAMRSKYNSMASTSITNGVANNEAFFNEAETDFSGRQSGMSGYVAAAGSNPFDGPYTTGISMTESQAEALGQDITGGPYQFNQMALSIDKVTVTAGSRALKAEYTMELAQDLKAIHGLDAETELANILSTEILAEINREIIRTLYYIAKPGAQKSTTTPGVFDLDTDSNGRWLEEKFKGLLFQIERDANQIARETRRGKGNFVICSSDVASALAMTGVMTYAPALQTNLNVDDTGNTFAGVLKNQTKVFIDPYFNNTGDLTTELLMIGYKGASPYDAGFFYCPYIPLQMVRAVGEMDFQPKIGFKTRYGLVANPYYTNASGAITSTSNPYYRLVKVANLT
jgi:Major capsid protein Gp23